MELLEESRVKNAQHEITGMLLHENGSFFQILEGPAEAVDRLYEQIAQDDRHTKTVTIIREPIAKRSFGAWTMGFPSLDSEELDEIIGLNDFFSGGSSFTKINSGRAKKLLAAFRDGRWRSKVKYTSSQQTQSCKQEQEIRVATSHVPRIS
ncbi:MAG: BLUF domain-containing protein, partial [Cyanobacteria bacterium J06641_5]